MSERPKNANIKTIAQQAEVSPSTVSRALRSGANVHRETRSKILRIAEEVGYVPNRAAQILVGGRRPVGTSLIGILYDVTITMSDHYFSRVIRSIVAEANESGLVTTISSISDHYDSITAYARQLKERQTAGLILVGNIDDRTIEVFHEHTPNMVIVDKPTRLVTSVCNDNEWGAYQATSYLARKGFRRIALLESYPNHYFTESVRAGYVRALGDAQLPYDPEICVDGEYHLSNGYEPMKRLLALPEPPEAVFANDEMGVGALKAIREAGLGVPEDVSVFGFDNLALAEHVHPPLSTVGVKYGHMAKTAVRVILDNLEQDDIIPLQITIPVELIHRGSVGKP